jgi:H+/Cl- antiporter ClcA
VTEMTNEHSIIFPMMAAALVADLVARFIMPVPLYHIMVERIAGHEDDDNN